MTAAGPPPSPFATLRPVARLAGVVVAAMGVVVLVGWAFDIAAIKSVVPALPSMPTNTALSFLLLGTSLAILAKPPPDRRLVWLAKALALGATVLGVLTLIEYGAGVDLGIDRLLLPASAVVTSVYPGRPPIPGAANFVLLGLALGLVDMRWPKRIWISQYLAGLAAVIAGTFLLGYVYVVSPVYTASTTYWMPLHGASGFLTLAVALVCARPERSVAMLLAERGTVGRLTRTLTLAAILLPVLIGGLALLGRHAGLYDAAYAIAILVISLVAILLIVVLVSGSWLARGVARRDQAEAAVQASERRFREVVESAPDAVVATDARFVITSWNRAAERIYGWSTEEALGRPVRDLLPTRISDQEREKLQRVLRETGLLEADYIQHRRDGTPIQVSARTVALRAADGSITGTVTLSRDVTETRRVERDRDLLFNFSLDLLCIAGFDGYFKQLNPAWEKVLGWTNGELMSTPYLDFVHPEDRQPTIDAAGGLAEGKTVITFENRYRCKDGSYRWISWNSYPLMEEKLIFADARDITERKNAEEQIARQAKELTRSNAELEQFAYVASHDLQEPLRMVASYTQLLAKRYTGKLGEEADEFIGFAVDGANRMRSLINDLLTYSRVSTRGREFQPTDVDAILDQVLADHRLAVEESDTEITKDPMPTVMADEAQLAHVFLNLVGNAIKFRGAGRPRVHIGAGRKGREWIFSVRDNGIGIDPKYFDRLFVMFQRLHGRDEYPGTGIGLAVCKKIVERHGGRIWVESGPGQGSTFYFTIPERGSG